MMSLLIGFLTFVMVVICLFLILLILIQLPKKEAGAGVAFGGGATDALFGAGSGNALTKMTKYTATIFVGMALGLSLLNSQRSQEGNRRLEEELRKKANQTPAMGSTTKNEAVAASKTQTFQSQSIESTNLLKTALTNQPANTNAAAAPVIRTPSPTNSMPATNPTNSPAPAAKTPAGNPAPAPTASPAAPPK